MYATQRYDMVSGRKYKTLQIYILFTIQETIL